MMISHPVTPEQRQARDLLLAATLREGGSPFAIADEYPLVLDASQSQRSFILEEEGEVVAHLNYWPRSLLNQNQKPFAKVALIGNVATHPRHRGKGHMRNLMRHVEKVAHNEDVQALFLWSDLLQFYQTLGFQSLGEELRFFFNIVNLRKKLSRPAKFAAVDPQTLSEQDLRRMLNQRPQLPATLERSTTEFKTLLSIPGLAAFATSRDGDIAGYALMGKGCDMVGVVHEWGADRPEEILSAVLAAGESCGLDHVLLLTPATLSMSWNKTLREHAVTCETHPMALMKKMQPLPPEGLHMLQSTFIWGLDSI